MSVCRRWDERGANQRVAEDRSDQQAALSVLDGVVTANGWTGIPAGATLTASGAFTSASGNSADFTIVVNGPSKLLTIHASTGDTTVQLRGGVAVTTVSGVKTYDPAWMGLEEFGFLPFLGPLGTSERKRVSISPDSVDTLHPLLHVYVVHDTMIPANKGFDVSSINAVVDTSSHQITQTESCDRLAGKSRSGISVKRVFTNFVKQAGISYATTITETRGGVPSVTITITALGIQPAQAAN